MPRHTKKTHTMAFSASKRFHGSQKDYLFFLFFRLVGNPLTKCLNYTEDDHFELNESAVNRWDLESSVATNIGLFYLLLLVQIYIISDGKGIPSQKLSPFVMLAH